MNINQYQAGFSIPTTFESQPPFNFGSCFFEDRSYGKSRGKGWGKNSYEDYSTFGFFRPVFLLLPKGHGPNGKPRCFGEGRQTQEKTNFIGISMCWIGNGELYFTVGLLIVSVELVYCL